MTAGASRRIWWWSGAGLALALVAGVVLPWSTANSAPSQSGPSAAVQRPNIGEPKPEAGDKNRDKERRCKPQPPVVELEPAELGLRVGERLVYDLRVSGVPAGKATFEVRKEEKHGTDGAATVWVAAVEGRSNRAVCLFYDARLRARSFIDTKGGFSRGYALDRQEGEVRAHERISFRYDFGNMEATCERPRPRADGGVPEAAERQWALYNLPICSKMLDPVSVIYFLRAQKWSRKNAGDQIILPVCADRRIWNTVLHVGERSTLRLPGLDDRECVEVQPEIEYRGLFERRGPLTLWIDVRTGIILRMTVETPIGAGEALLSDWKDSPLER